jgi:hypothetical protein
MSALVLLDTSVYLNILDVPSFNQDREVILDEFEIRFQDQDLFFLPMATIWETGNHIADLANGSIRYQYGKKLLEDITKAINGEVPYRATHFPSREEFLAWLAEFPEYVQRNKNDKKIREGVSLSDLSIIKEWEATRDRHPMSHVLIWSLDSDLAGYDTGVR